MIQYYEFLSSQAALLQVITANERTLLAYLLKLLKTPHLSFSTKQDYCMEVSHMLYEFQKFNTLSLVFFKILR